MRSLLSLACLTAALALPTSARAGDEAGFKPLFDGKTLNGWVGDPRFWSVEDGTIVGSTDQNKAPHNTFLATTKSYKNFVLKAEFKLRNHNSGIQVRSKLLPDYVVHGYQPDIAECVTPATSTKRAGGERWFRLTWRKSRSSIRRASGPSTPSPATGRTSRWP